MNVAELDLQGYEVIELGVSEAESIEGGIIGPIIIGVTVGVVTTAIVDSINNPDDFWDGYNAATS